MTRASSRDRSIKDEFEKALLQYISVMVMVTTFAIIFAACQPIGQGSKTHDDAAVREWVTPAKTDVTNATMD